ncbi:unnamed protein product [Lactuca saligna]|uniref:Uncharacterized protein n=1 Tax=Lactuca saligna TaxID=75948 RepID=A0AA36A268_LACSI|nr:unnamed protein product [Lactuca saligna]
MKLVPLPSISSRTNKKLQGLIYFTRLGSSSINKRYLKGGGNRRYSDISQSLVFITAHKELEEEFINEIDEAGRGNEDPWVFQWVLAVFQISGGSDDTGLRSKFRAIAPTVGSIARMVMGGGS